MAKIQVKIEYPIKDGTSFTFHAPCDCSQVDGLTVTHPLGKQDFVFKDAHGNILTGINNLFVRGSLIQAVLDVTKGSVFLQNADTNSYLERLVGVERGRIDNLVAPNTNITQNDVCELDDGDVNFPFRATISSNGVNCKIDIDLSDVEVDIGDEKVSNYHPLPFNFAPMGNVYFENEAYVITLEAGAIDEGDGIRDVRLSIKNKTTNVLSVQAVTMYYPVVYPSTAETRDIRVGYDGKTTYATAGEAVRAAHELAANANELANDANGDAGRALREIEELKKNGTGGGDVSAVRFTEQELTDEQKEQARKNIDVGAKMLVFTVTLDEDGNYTSSKTYSELISEINNKRHVICRIDNIYDDSHNVRLPLAVTRSGLLEFRACTVGEYLTVLIMRDAFDNTKVTFIREKPSITINDRVWNWIRPNVDFTDTINKMIDDNVTPRFSAVEEVANDLSEAISFVYDNNPVVNVRDHGAVGDGVIDDTEAIQAALHDAEKRGLPLYIPAGNYLVSKTITTHTRDKDEDKQSKALNIYGAGMNTKFITAEAFEGEYVFHIDVKNAQPRQLWVHDFAIDLVADVSGIYFREIGMKAVVENLWITYLYDKDPSDTNVRAGIYCGEATVTTFQRIKIYGNRKRIGQGHENIGIVCEASYSTKFIDCDIIFCKWAIYLSGGSNNLIEYCRIDENEYGVYQNTTAPSINYMPETRAYPADGKKFQGTARNLTIRNNRFEANNQQAIFLAAYSYGDMNYMYNAQVTIANNDFSALGKGIAFQTSEREVFRKAIWLYQCKGVVIENNCFSGQPYDETVADTLMQNLVGERIEDITLRGNVAIALPIWHDDGSHTIEKTNPVLSVEFVEATDFIPDVEADQCTRYSLGDLSLALDRIIEIQNALIGGPVTLITFTMPNGVQHQAEEGMTWGEWIGSQYNTAGYILNNGYVYDPIGNGIYDYADGGYPETADLAIIAGHAYVYD